MFANPSTPAIRLIHPQSSAVMIVSIHVTWMLTSFSRVFRRSQTFTCPRVQSADQEDDFRVYSKAQRTNGRSNNKIYVCVLVFAVNL